MRNYEPRAGMHVSRVDKEMVALANETGETVKTSFNGVELIANPGDDPNTIVNFFNTELKHQREAEETQCCEGLVLKSALAAAPKKMTLRDEEAWKKSIEADIVICGGEVTSFAERWARLMEGRIANGDTVSACAEESSYLAGKEEITGFMYGCAVPILSQAWIHGDELRRWHNGTI